MTKKSLSGKRLADSAEAWLARNRSLVLRQTPVWAQSLLCIVLSVGGIGILGSIVLKIDEVISVTGQLESSSGSTKVKSPVGGQVAAVFFKDGESVQKGDLLLRFDTRQAENQKRTLEKLINLEEGKLKSQQQILEERKKVFKQKLETSKTNIQELQDLVYSGGYQRIQYLKQLDSYFEIKSQLDSIDLEIKRLRIDSQKNISEMKTRLNTANIQIQYQNVKAPVEGIVFDPQVSPNGVLQPGVDILTIVPQGNLKASVLVPNKDIGFVAKDQKAMVRVDAFPFTRYGELTGYVKTIGADSLPPDNEYSYFRFPVQVDLNKSYLENKGIITPLRSGMAVTANIKLREKSVISLLSDMLVNQVDSVKKIRQQ